MSTVMKKSFDNPDEVRAPDKAKVSVCDLGGIAAAKLVLQPGLELGNMCQTNGWRRKLPSKTRWNSDFWSNGCQA